MTLDLQTTQTLRGLLLDQRIAALGTVSGSDPRVSMVLYACSPDATALYLHVSHLSDHTREMLDHPTVGLLITESDRESRNPLSLARLSIQGIAMSIQRDDPLYAPAKAAYLERHPGAAVTFQLGDFVLFTVRPLSARLVAGFARAFDIAPDTLREVIIQ